jgi:hypothetical protein
LNVSKTGFQTQVFESVQVQTGRTTSVNVSLKVGGMMQAVTVAATETPLVEPDSSVLADTIDTKQVTSLPVIGRNLFNLALLVLDLYYCQWHHGHLAEHAGSSDLAA